MEIHQYTHKQHFNEKGIGISSRRTKTQNKLSNIVIYYVYHFLLTFSLKTSLYEGNLFLLRSYLNLWFTLQLSNWEEVL